MKALRELFWFGVAGTLGFVVDTGVLYLLKGWMGLVVGRLFSFLAAVFATWVAVHASWTAQSLLWLGVALTLGTGWLYFSDARQGRRRLRSSQ